MANSQKTGHYSSRLSPRSSMRRGESLGLAAGNLIRTIQQVREGFPYSSLVRFHQRSGLPIGTIAHHIQLPQRTLMRRKARGRLEPQESERLLRISGVFEIALQLFEGRADEARRWLTIPNAALGNQPPLDFARTEIGAREVEDLIGRLEHGVFT